MNVAGCHRVRPRLIFFTDGRPTDEATEFGPDTQSNISEVCLHTLHDQYLSLCFVFLYLDAVERVRVRFIIFIYRAATFAQREWGGGRHSFV